MSTSDEDTSSQQAAPATEDDDDRNADNVRYGTNEREEREKAPPSAREQASRGGQGEPNATGKAQTEKNAENEPAS